jgi:glycosyltransferase involved in cell wall biosynthesis
MTTLPAPTLSIIIPVLNEAAGIAALLQSLQGLRAQGAEIIVADGGSADATIQLALPLADQVMTAPKGRASQMNAGAAIARAPLLLFLHADTRLPAGAMPQLFPDLPLMEDISFSRQMKRLGRPACLSEKVITSGWRWEKHGVLRTVLLMWSLRLRFFFGADPADLAREYGYAPRQP